MNILIIGSGGREHALAWKIAASPLVDQLYCAPGNAGIAREAQCVAIDQADHATVVAFCKARAIDFVVVGPEAPLAAGLVDDLESAGIKAFGPTKAAARLEGSKGFTKDLCRAHDIPTAAYERFNAVAPAKAHVRAHGAPIVIKADGLAAGKGVVVAQTVAEAETAIEMILGGGLGDAGAELVIEEFLVGEEASFFVLCDGETALPLATAQDHKRAFDDDRGPNTGGMGAFAPSPLVDAALEGRIMREIVAPVVAGMAREGCPFRGFLYAGLMLTADGPKVIEFNVRLGDPEAQVVLSLVDEPLAPVLAAAAAGRLAQTTIALRREPRVGVVLASRGYPESSESGRAIDGIEAAEAIPGVTVYHAGTAMRDGRLVTAGGRVLTVVGHGIDYAEAVSRAYAGVLQISFDGMQYRRDIGRRAIAR